MKFKDQTAVKNSAQVIQYTYNSIARMNSKLLIVMYSELNYITLGNAYQLNENMAHPLNLPSSCHSHIKPIIFYSQRPLQIDFSHF